MTLRCLHWQSTCRCVKLKDVMFAVYLEHDDSCGLSVQLVYCHSAADDVCSTARHDQMCQKTSRLLATCKLTVVLLIQALECLKLHADSIWLPCNTQTDSCRACGSTDQTCAATCPVTLAYLQAPWMQKMRFHILCWIPASSSTIQPCILWIA